MKRPSEDQADAWLYGTVTTKEFLYYVSIDTQGEIGREVQERKPTYRLLHQPFND